ncbi:MAG: hypothetical protein HFG33_05040 [Bacilli bacterium]|nr:hypothetical protein [Bacilli bacterium]
MKKKKFLLIAFAFVASLFVAQNVYAASYKMDFNNFSGRYSFTDAFLNGIDKIKYAMVKVTSTTGKYTVELGRQWSGVGSYEMIAQTISTYNNESTIYFIPQSMSCPSGYTTCVTVSESKPGVGYDYIADHSSQTMINLISKSLFGSKMTGYIIVYNL